MSASVDDDGIIVEEQRGAVRLLTLTYPARRNALSMRMRAMLRDALAAAIADPGCRAIVLAGQGGVFCSGADVGSFAGITPPGGRMRMQAVHVILRSIIAGPKPVIAAIEGAALGAGLGLAAACDIVVASEEAKFSAPFNRFGLLPDWGTTWTLPRRMGAGQAKLLMLSGRRIDAQVALRMGLVDQLAPAGQALDQALALADDVALGAPLSNEMIKALSARDGLEEALAAEADAQGVLYGSEDYVEGYTAFREKRAPNFGGR